MLVCMDPSSPPVKRTLHLLKTPDILLANDIGLTGSYFSSNSFGLLANTASSGSPNAAQGHRRAFRSQLAPAPTDLPVRDRSGPRFPRALPARGASPARRDRRS